MNNKETSLRYQSYLSRTLRDAPWGGTVPKVHALRGIYTCMILRLFQWGKHSDSFVAMCVLGHAALEESLAYTAYDIGNAVPNGALGDGKFTPVE